MKTALKFSKVRDVKGPTRGTSCSAGIDFYIPEDFEPYSLEPQCDILIPSGIVCSIPEGYMLMGADKSGIATSYMAQKRAGREPKNKTLMSPIIIGAKIIDEDYQGEIGLHLINAGFYPVILQPGQKIAQFILVPVNYASPVEVPFEELFNEKSERGEGGWGSTGQE